MPLISELHITEEDFQAVSRLVYNHCGINLHDGKRQLVQARLAKLMRSSGCQSVGEYLQFVEDDRSGATFTQLIDAISTNLTSFFRENNHFEYLSGTFLPDILARKRRSGDMRLRAWSAGCSTGEEPYTLSIVLKEAIEKAGGSWDVVLLATDISTRVLAHAQQGVYGAARLEQVDVRRRERFFERLPGPDGAPAYRVNQDLKQIIRFRYLNLMQDWPFKGPFDFIFCRNVMIYFDKPTQQKLVGRYRDCLEPGGLLFTGHSESLTGIDHKFKYVQPTIYART